jgi:hypothetical protein
LGVEAYHDSSEAILIKEQFIGANDSLFTPNTKELMIRKVRHENYFASKGITPRKL